MQKLTILNTKEIKRLKEILSHEFGYFPRGDYVYLRNEKKRIFIISKDIAKIDLKKLIVDKVGLYFGENLGAEFRLSKEGAQLLGLEARKNQVELKNVVKLNKEEVKEYFSGMNLVKELGSESKLVLLKYQQDILGCAKYKEGKILNFLPKIHRGEVIL